MEYLLFIPTYRIKIFNCCFLVFLQKEHNVTQWEIHFQSGLPWMNGSFPTYTVKTQADHKPNGKSAQAKDSSWDKLEGIRETEITKDSTLEQNKDYFLGHRAKGFLSLP